jgi:hypothetical protein
MVKRPNLHLCIDRVIPADLKIEAANRAVEEASRNDPGPLLLKPGVTLHPFKLALFTGKMWQNGRTLGVRFLDGSALQRSQVEKYAASWSKYANIEFDFSAAQAEIRVSFAADPGSWSAVGTDCLVATAFKKGDPTVNFGWLRDDTDETEWRRVVTHEFGHALGAIHEHQSPKGGIQWNLPAVYAYFSGPPNNWTKAEIDYNIVQKYSVTQLNATRFDIKSIMLYSFPPQLIVGGAGTPNNTRLSPTDKRWIARQYPRP